MPTRGKVISPKTHGHGGFGHRHPMLGSGKSQALSHFGRASFSEVIATCRDSCRLCLRLMKCTSTWQNMVRPTETRQMGPTISTFFFLCSLSLCPSAIYNSVLLHRVVCIVTSCGRQTGICMCLQEPASSIAKCMGRFCQVSHI